MSTAASPIRLLLADVDGTLVTQDKALTPRSIRAVHALHDAGILFAVTSGSPPRGMEMLVDPLALTTPISAFNGGLVVEPDMNDVLMFARSGLAIAMGQSGAEVHRAARRVTTSNEEDGFANAVDRFFLRASQENPTFEAGNEMATDTAARKGANHGH